MKYFRQDEQMSDRKVRIGNRCGGTFTHAVAIDAASFQLIDKVKVPTTHTSEIGVGERDYRLSSYIDRGEQDLPDEVCLIAHSTTQATNALLEAMWRQSALSAWEQVFLHFGQECKQS